MAALEDKIIAEFKEGKALAERTLLAVSGLKTEEAIYSYQSKLDFIQGDFEKSCPERDDDYQAAKYLFNYLWRTKPNRYNGDFLLTKVIDNQLDEDRNKGVGNCLGLTSLYTVLGQRQGLNLSVLVSTDHILNLLSCSNQEIVVENNSVRGFDSELKLRYKKSDLIGLVVSVLISRGEVKHSSGKLRRALRDYDRAIKLAPDSALPFNNRGVVKMDLGNLKSALQDYNRAIELEPDYAHAFNNRGIVKKDLGHLNSALRDYNRAIELNPDYAFAFNNRGIVKGELKDLYGALRDYNRAIELNPDYAFTFNNRGNVKGELKDLYGALRDYNRAIELKPDLAIAFNNRELLLRHMQGLPR